MPIQQLFQALAEDPSLLQRVINQPDAAAAELAAKGITFNEQDGEELGAMLTDLEGQGGAGAGLTPVNPQQPFGPPPGPAVPSAQEALVQQGGGLPTSPGAAIAGAPPGAIPAAAPPTAPGAPPGGSLGGILSALGPPSGQQLQPPSPVAPRGGTYKPDTSILQLLQLLGQGGQPHISALGGLGGAIGG